MNHTVEALKRHNSVPTYIFLALFSVMVLQSIGARIFYAGLNNSQTLRDMTGLTPFKDVTVTKTRVTEEGLKVWGVFEKLGCVVTERVAFTRDADGTIYPAVFIRTPGRVGKVRPILPGVHQSFGPVTIKPLTDQPATAGIAFTVQDCPDPMDGRESISVTDMFFNVPWADSDNPQPQPVTFRP